MGSHLNYIAHDARSKEAVGGDGDCDVPLHLASHPHLLKTVLLNLQLPLVFERRLGHVGQKMSEFHILAQSFLVSKNER